MVVEKDTFSTLESTLLRMAKGSWDIDFKTLSNLERRKLFPTMANRASSSTVGWTPVRV